MKSYVVLLMALTGLATQSASAQIVQTVNGRVEGVTLESGTHVFRGIPYAAPPVRDLRWRPPQPAPDWTGVRPADRFGPQCMQQRVFDDMVFRSEGTSEDCLYLNVWTPEVAPEQPLPVLVYFYGGGFIAGDGSEPRYDGESMATKGIVAVTMNYRLGVFGFFAHPQLTAESPEGASGNYGLMDQSAALRWVKENIASFGGDPGRITIAGESAGSFSVSAQMASALSRNLIAGAIGESGSLLRPGGSRTLSEAEATGIRFAEMVGAEALADLRAMPATLLLNVASSRGMPRFSAITDGYFFPEPPVQTFAAGEQADVPLLLGWNSEESSYRSLLGENDPTPENFAAAVRARYGDAADEVLRVYPAETADDVVEAATALAGDTFIGVSTWKWFDVHRQTSNAPVYRYFYAQPRPGATGAAHSAEIEYAMGNLDRNEVFDWTDDDYAVSRAMQEYFANFIRTGDPNGAGLPEWPAAGAGPDDASMVMWIEPVPHAEPERLRERYETMMRILGE